MNGNISEFCLELFSTLGFFSEFLLIFLIFEIDCIEVTLRFAWLCIGIAFLPVMAFGSKFLLQLFDILFFMVLDFLYFELHRLSFLFLKFFHLFNFLSLSFKVLLFNLNVFRHWMAQCFPKLLMRCTCFENVCFVWQVLWSFLAAFVFFITSLSSLPQVFSFFIIFVVEAPFIFLFFVWVKLIELIEVFWFARVFSSLREFTFAFEIPWFFNCIQAIFEWVTFRTFPFRGFLFTVFWGFSFALRWVFPFRLLFPKKYHKLKRTQA